MRTFIKRILYILLALVVLLAALWASQGASLLFRPTETTAQPGASSVLPPDNTGETNLPPITVIAEDLSVPWDIAFLPDGSLLVTERPGTLARIATGGQIERIAVPDIAARSEGGLLGLALHPQFIVNQYLYLYEGRRTDAGLINTVARYRFDTETNALGDRHVIIDDIPGAIFHDGGGLAFGPDGLLYITTGDAREPALSQNRDSLAGKTLRLTDDGAVPVDNPFGTAVYSYGHRNAQGLTWDAVGALWQTEHGRSGVRSGLDELNRITAGTNYGWPEIQGDEVREGMEAPVLHSGPSETWAPASAQYLNGSVFFGGLRGQALFEARGINTDSREMIAHFLGEYGRIRAVVLGPDGFLYLSTSNTDGRGTPQPGDDKIIRVDPSILPR